ncbi:glycosyltransferase family 4 protein (plasmid) [Agrobacterium leguminum]|uniref:glycosyltransferase family 4 protein n=1 Tax=Agrobacterium leguminum TaxID=2792015 RepID=UPI00272CFDE7|nr:glycosyltransferase family 4 protein [Agrobacterium leguminum]WLE00544.1 glycosyltransferase family 4 protein [Agrobacterium leguminum]
MIVFCHLLNDRSGSPRVLCSTMEALGEVYETRLYIGSQGRGSLENVSALKRRYWYRRSRLRIVTMFNLMVSQIRLYRMLSAARDIPADAVIYMNTLLPFGAALWAKRNRRRLICHVHEISISPAPFRRFLTGIVARAADLLIYVSEDHMKRLPIASQRAVVQFNPVQSCLRKRGEATPFSPRRSGSFEVLMLASARDFKGIPEFFGLAQAMSDRPDIAFKLVLNADGTEITRYLGSRKIPANVGIYSQTDDPSNFYASADLVVNLSRIDLWVETFGLTLIEAMSFGVPVVAPPVGGPTEIVTGGEEGFLIDSRNPEALVEAVQLLADDPGLSMKMSAAARKKSAQFSQEAYARGLFSHVNAVAKRSEQA